MASNFPMNEEGESAFYQKKKKMQNIYKWQPLEKNSSIPKFKWKFLS